jgi:3-deoxy-D-manno-octulosonic-acid transferase
MMEKLYELLLALARPAFGLATLFNDRARQAVEGRRRSLHRFQEWGWMHRDPDRPLVWLHAPSVGEALMAQATIRELRKRRPAIQVAFSHFSPSAERMVDQVGADVHGYIPWDTRFPVRSALDALDPAVVAFVRTEVWPVVTREAKRRGIRLALVNGVVSEGSGRLSWLGRTFLEQVYRRLDGIGAVSSGSAERFERLGVPPGVIRVTGDARFDQVWARIEDRDLRGLRAGTSGLEHLPEEMRPIWTALRDPDTFTLVAGSTWPADEKVLVPTVAVLRRSRNIRLIIAPHEPTRAHLDAIERRFDRQPGVQHARLKALLSGGGRAPEVVLIDRVGILADLYALADAAYVGGGFGTAGLHSVVEPAALGVPVLFGPAHGNAREADALAEAGGGFVVEAPGDVEEKLREWMDQAGSVEEAGRRAREYVRTQIGSAQRNAEMILELVDGTNPWDEGTQPHEQSHDTDSRSTP